MTYQFPPSLHPLRDYLRKQGFAGDSVKTSRQAAFVAQQLLGTRIKFPPQGQDMSPTLIEIQKAVQASANLRDQPAKKPKKASRPQLKKGKKISPYGKKANYQKFFTPDRFAEGVHIFCDGACEPNPGPGGWGVVVYRDSVEIDTAFGGEADSTNNVMEPTALLNAIEKAKGLSLETEEKPVTIWCDSQYCVRGVNEWMAGWKANGWQRGGDKAEPKNRVLANADLWKAIDEALLNIGKSDISIRWVKGHIGVAGNERADGLADMGRMEAEAHGSVLSHGANLHHEDLDERYRQIMGAL